MQTAVAVADGTGTAAPEERRLTTLRRAGLLAAAPEPAFDRLIRLACRLLGTPVGLVSLVASDRQVLAGQQGFPEPWAGLRKTPLSHSFCRHVVARNAPLVIPDTRVHPLVRDNPAVLELGVAAYLGAPLRAPDGQALGAVCVIDAAPHAWSEDDLALVRDLAETAGGEVAFRLGLAERAQAERRLATEHAVAQVLAEARDLERAGPRMLERLCATLEMDTGELWMPEPDEERLTCVAFHAAVPDAAAFRRAILRLKLARGVGLVGRVWACGEAAWIADVAAEPSLPRAPAAAASGLHTGFAFPIMLDGACAGVLCFSSRRVLPRDEPLVAMVTSVGRGVGEFLKRSRAERELRERNRALEALDRLSVTISGELDRDRLVQLVVDAATGLVGASFGAFFHDLAAEGGGSYGLYTLSGAPREAFARFPPLRATGVFGPTLLGKEVVRSDDITRDPRYGRNPPHRGMPEGHLPVRSYLAAPVVARSGRVSGALIFGHPKPGVFGEPAKRLVVGIAAQAAVAIENAELYRAARRELEERRRAEEAGQAKADFLAAMSHEIRTPLTGVLGMADLLAAEDLPDGARARVETIRASGRHLLHLVNDVLDFSRVEAGKLELERIDFVIPDLLGRVRTVMAPQAAERGLELGTEFDERSPPVVRGDPMRLKQVLLNLVGNGLKFTERGGVLVRVVPCREDGGWVRLRFEVRDTGVGIREEKRAALFEAFTQADRSTTRRYGGSGLGLAICKRLVEAMGGAIGVESAPGEGSLFWFEVPLEVGDAAVVAAERAASDPASVPPLRVLVAEDAAVNRELLRAMLGRHGHEVALAVDGAEAVELASRERFDLVLMDVRMPAMDGVEATRRIRELPPPAGTVPIVALTADVAASERERYLAAGMDECLAKPVDWARLFAVLARLREDPARPNELSASAAPEEAREEQPPESSLVTGTGEDPQIDGAAVDRLVARLPAAVGEDLLGRAVDDAERACARLAALPAGSGELLEEAHKLRGVAGAFGLACVRDAAVGIEAAARGGGDVAGAVGRLARAVAATRAGLRKAGPLAGRGRPGDRVGPG